MEPRVRADSGLTAFKSEIGMWALRTESELILKSRWVSPETLTDAGFAFAHTDLEAALAEVHDRAAA